MKATVLDTVTGKRIVKDGIRSFEWACNNWSCDCNRQLLFGIDEGDGICIGGKRFLVVSAEMNDSEDDDYTLEELNSEYPVELLIAHGIVPLKGRT